ncbi:MAG: hypothetical protein QW478_03315 [Candidatus Micrarchaeaceae archaeon]
MNLYWPQVLTSLGIPYKERGKNVGKNNVAIACPWCGDDPSQHLNLSKDPNKPWYYCFRNPDHSGRNPFRLLEKLAGPLRAQEILKEVSAFTLSAIPAPSVSSPPPFSLDDIGEEKPEDEEIIAEYLSRIRHIPNEKIAKTLIALFSLRLGHLGPYRNRIVIPIEDHKNKIRGVTARAIGKQEPRYYTKKGQECPPFLGCHLVFEGVRGIILVEGPFDCLKLYSLLLDQKFGILADVTVLAYLGERIRNHHLSWLLSHVPSTTALFVIPDYDNIDSWYRRGQSMASLLSPFYPKTYVLELPKGIKDPDGLDANSAIDIFSNILERLS